MNASHGVGFAADRPRRRRLANDAAPVGGG